MPPETTQNIGFSSSVEVSATDPGVFGNTEEVSLSDTERYPGKQPYLPRVKVYIPENSDAGSSNKDISISSDDLLEVLPQNLLNFTHDVLVNGIGEFTLTIFDPNFNYVEEKVRNSKGRMVIQYGYESEDDFMSPKYACKVYQYSIEKFLINGTIIKFIGLTTGFNTALIRKYQGPTSDTQKEKGPKKISDVVKDIAEILGYTDTVIEESQDLLSQDDISTTDYISRFVNQKGETDFRLILNELVRTVNSDKQHFVFYIEPTGDGKDVLHFHSITYEQENDNTDPVSAFTLFKSPNSPVISFRPDWDVTVKAIAGGSATYYSMIDATNKKLVEKTYNTNTNPPKPDGGSITPSDPPSNETNESSSNVLCYYVDKEASFCRNADEADATASVNISEKLFGALTAELDIVGNVFFDLCAKIAVIVYIPTGKMSTTFNNNTKNYHWTSGFYRVIGIKHSFKPGEFITTLSLMTNGRNTV